jgi:hypothetical protein
MSFAELVTSAVGSLAGNRCAVCQPAHTGCHPLARSSISLFRVAAKFAGFRDNRIRRGQAGRPVPQERGSALQRYGIGTDIELETPTLLVAVMVNDCSMWTRSLVLLPLDKTKGIAIRNAPPKGVDAVL